MCPDATTEVTFDAYGRDEVDLPQPDEILGGTVAQLVAELDFPEVD